MRKPLVIAGVVLVLGAVVPVVVLAAAVGTSSNLDRQIATSVGADATTSSTRWRNVPGLARISACTIRQVTATLSVTLAGAPALFRVIIDTPEGPMRPGNARFVPNGRESFSYTFVRRTIPFEDDDTHSFSVQWRSPSGQPVTLTSGVVNLIFQRGTHNCP
ncbi:MAG: hypothetical protein ACRDNI_12385 [Gaiellaceae bacterium]